MRLRQRRYHLVAFWVHSADGMQPASRHDYLSRVLMSDDKPLGYYRVGNGYGELLLAV